MKINRTIEPVVNDGLCTGCGTCVGLCPRDAIELVIDKTKGLYIPQLDRGRCSECGICFEVCPGHSVDFTALNQDIFGKQPEDVLLGNYLNCYVGHATDYEIRYNSASGGLVTALLTFALEEGLIDGALVTRMNHEKPLEPEPFIARTREDVISAARSKYCPVPANIALKEILENEGKFAVVGLPCHIHGIRKAEAVNKKLKEKIALHLGLFCSHSDNFRETDFILRKWGIKREDVARLDYRGEGWPGAMTVYFREGTKQLIPFGSYIIAHQFYFFTPMRCTLCWDIDSELADISFGDAWIPELTDDKTGKSSLVSRTAIGENYLQKAWSKGEIAISRISSGKIKQQNFPLRKVDLAARFSINRLGRNKTPCYNIKLPSLKLTSYLRSFLVYLNIYLSSRRLIWGLITPIAHMEQLIFNISKMIAKLKREA